jgi:hypothetical protein
MISVASNVNEQLLEYRPGDQPERIRYPPFG